MMLEFRRPINNIPFLFIEKEKTDKYRYKC